MLVYCWLLGCELHAVPNQSWFTSVLHAASTTIGRLLFFATAIAAGTFRTNGKAPGYLILCPQRPLTKRLANRAVHSLTEHLSTQGLYARRRARVKS